MAILDYDMTEDYTNEYALFEDGDYTVTIVDGGEVKDTRNGKMLVLTYAFDSGRTYKDNHNFVNSNATAQNIARASIQSIFDACGIPKNPSTDILAGKRMIVTIGHEMGKPYTDKNGVDRAAKEQNKITAYKRTGAAQAAPAQVAAPAAKPHPFAKK
jgi:hypothetical protein